MHQDSLPPQHVEERTDFDRCIQHKHFRRSSVQVGCVSFKEINVDVIVNGELAVGKSSSASNRMTSGSVAGNNASFNDKVLASKFTPNRTDAGIQGGTGGATTPTSDEPTNGGTDLSGLGMESL